MKILLVTTAFPRWQNDHRVPFMSGYANAIDQAGADVQVIAMHEPGTKTFETFGDIQIHRPRYLPESWEILRMEEGGLPVFWQKYRLARVVLLPFLLSQFVSVTQAGAQVDIIHANWILSGIITYLSSFIHRTPYIITIHGSDLHAVLSNVLLRLIARAALQRAQRIIAVSRSISDQLHTLGIDRGKISIIPNGIDCTVFLPGEKSETPTALFVGNLTQAKGIHNLVHSMPEALRKITELRLNIIGGGPLREEIADQCAALSLQDHVCILGHLPPNLVAEWMRKSHVLVLPSIREGFGVVLIEAMASGTPCIASAVGGIPDVISKDVGILVPPNDPSAIAHAIVELLHDPVKYMEISHRAREKAQRTYDWPQIAKKIMNLYQDILAPQTADLR